MIVPTRKPTNIPVINFVRVLSICLVKVKAMKLPNMPAEQIASKTQIIPRINFRLKKSLKFLKRLKK